MNQSLQNDLKLILKNLEAAMNKADALALGTRNQLSGLMVKASDSIGMAKDFVQSAINSETTRPYVGEERRTE